MSSNIKRTPRTNQQTPTATATTMSNKLWVKWKSSDSSSMEYYCGQVVGLADDANVDDLRRAFVQQLEPDVRRPAALQVHEKEGQTKLEEDALLSQYFIVNGESEQDKKQPGRSKGSALFLLIFPPQQNNNMVSR
jgi:hypothetical protein